MTTAREVIDSAYLKIGVRAAETPLSASEVQDALETLNDMLAEWAATGVLKEAHPVKEPDDNLEIPRYSVGAVKSHLAIRLSSEFDRPVSQSLQASAAASMANLIKASINLTVNFPSILPTGSGNYDQIGQTRDFFPGGKQRNF